MAFLVKFCRRQGLIQGCTNIESINMNPPAVLTRKYEDQCGCRTCCSYPNYVWAILPAQILTLVALTSTVASYAKCKLFKVPNTPENGIDAFTINTLYNGTIPTGIENDNATYRSIGLFAWEDIEGACSYDSYEGSSTDGEGTADLLAYWEFLGSDFRALRLMAGIVTTLGFLILVWMICLLSCVAHTRRYRGIVVFLLLFLLPLLQLLTFRVRATKFCRENGCKLGESFRIGISAVVFYFLAGLLLCIATQDFPGNPYRKRKPPLQSTLRMLFGQRSETSSDNDIPDNTNPHLRPDGSPMSDAEMTPYHNGFADAVEIPVTSEFIDRTLIDADAAAPATLTHTTVELTEFLQSTSMAQSMSDNHATAVTSPHDLKSNV